MPFEPLQDRTDVGAVPLLGVAGGPAFSIQDSGYPVRPRRLIAFGFGSLFCPACKLPISWRLNSTCLQPEEISPLFEFFDVRAFENALR